MTLIQDEVYDEYIGYFWCPRCQERVPHGIVTIHASINWKNTPREAIVCRRGHEVQEDEDDLGIFPCRTCRCGC